MFNLVPFNNRRHRELDAVIDRFFNDGLASSMTPMVSSGIKVDIREDESSYYLEAEIPGVEKDQIRMSYENNYLTISVEQQDEVKEEKEHYICRERRMGKTSRTFHVKDINADEIGASYDKGVLKVTLPKKEESVKKTQIQIE